jgi:hypothetical protein
MSASLESQKNR